MVTWSPINAPWSASVTVTVVDAFVVANCVMEPVPRVGVIST